jgi:hypothetical protein
MLFVLWRSLGLGVGLVMLGRSWSLFFYLISWLIFGFWFVLGGGLGCGSFVNRSWKGLRCRVAQGIKGVGCYHGSVFPLSPADSMLPLLFMLNKLYISSIFKKNIIY